MVESVVANYLRRIAVHPLPILFAVLDTPSLLYSGIEVNGVFDQ